MSSSAAQQRMIGSEGAVALAPVRGSAAGDPTMAEWLTVGTAVAGAGDALGVSGAAAIGVGVARRRVVRAGGAEGDAAGGRALVCVIACGVPAGGGTMAAVGIGVLAGGADAVGVVAGSVAVAVAGSAGGAVFVGVWVGGWAVLAGSGSVGGTAVVGSGLAASGVAVAVVADDAGVGVDAGCLVGVAVGWRGVVWQAGAGVAASGVACAIGLMTISPVSKPRKATMVMMRCTRSLVVRGRYVFLYIGRLAVF